MSMKKLQNTFAFKFFTLGILLLFSSGMNFTFAQTDNSNLKSAKDEGKQVLTDIGSALKKIGSSVETEVNKGASKARIKAAGKLIGTWTFSNGTNHTIIVLNSDESMEITQKSLLDKRTWKGSFNAIGKTISFAISEGSDSGKTWELKYNLVNDKSMQITCSEIPDDYGGYDFSNSAVFLKNSD
ncbi:hypothetical protein [Treponema parvum]|uniref:hypothetical protein n=1 Tax=Treponema parvum TaxID=138851 RepID=UPI001AEC0C1D|nr:hypothetical protein [Treponema parvum]QTQ17089.1 hypothetical protein HXT04_10535 [Treponema parvum]